MTQQVISDTHVCQQQMLRLMKRRSRYRELFFYLFWLASFFILSTSMLYVFGILSYNRGTTRQDVFFLTMTIAVIGLCIGFFAILAKIIEVQADLRIGMLERPMSIQPSNSNEAKAQS